MREEGLLEGESRTTFRALRLRMRTLSFYRGALNDEVGQQIDVLVDLLTREDGLQETSEDLMVEDFSRLTALLLTEAAAYSGESVGDLWQNHLLDRILADTNLFSVAAERRQKPAIDGSVRLKVEAELRTLHQLYRLSLTQLQAALIKACPESSAVLLETWSDWEEVRPLHSGTARRPQRNRSLKEQFARTTDWATLIDVLAAHYAEAGTGLLSQYRAFRWVARDNVGAFEGIEEPDPVRVDDLVGYQREHEAVLRNTRQFVRGAPGNNVLIYGDAGTGKSSFVKALLNAFGDQGLRLVEVPKERLADFPYITRALRSRNERFVIFVDDLSFEEHETEYKALKAMLEGSLEARPENVLVYGTSNRRHLVREYFGDRSAPSSEDVHPLETLQEKISLAERFGIRVAFLAPDQERYFTIVSALAEKRGLSLPEQELRRRALQWAQWQNGFSGRTARQFIDDLVGVLAESRGTLGNPGGSGS